MKPTVYRPELLQSSIIGCMQGSCPRASHCLRHLHYQHSEVALSPQLLDPRLPVGEQCQHYVSAEPLRIGRGLRRLRALVPYGATPILQARLREVLACGRTAYYHYISGRWPLSPRQQDLVAEVFSGLGVTSEPLCDAYEEGYSLAY